MQSEREDLAQRHRSEPHSADVVVLRYEADVLRAEHAAAVAHRDALLQEREELHAVVLSLTAESADTSPAMALRLAPVLAQLARAHADRDALAAERDGLHAKLLACTTLLRERQLLA